MKVIGTNLKDKSQVFFGSVAEAASYLNLDDSHIVKCLKGKRNHHGGYTWSKSEISEDKEKILLSVKKEALINLGKLAKADKILFGNLEFTPEKWSEEEDNIIRKEYQSGNLVDISRILGRDVTAITLRAKLLGLERRRPRYNSRSSIDIANIIISSKEETLY